LRANPRASWLRHVESRLDDDMDAARACRYQEEEARGRRSAVGSVELVPVGGGGGSVQRSGAVETAGRRRGRGGSTTRRRTRAGAAAKSCGGDAGWEMEGAG
jgi:hypothetical protein